MNQSLHGNLKSSSWFGKQKIIINHTYDSIKIDEIINKISTELDDKKNQYEQSSNKDPKKYMIDINNIIKKYIELYPCDRKSIFGASKNLPVLNKDNEKKCHKNKVDYYTKFQQRFCVTNSIHSKYYQGINLNKLRNSEEYLYTGNNLYNILSLKIKNHNRAIDRLNGISVAKRERMDEIAQMNKKFGQNKMSGGKKSTTTKKPVKKPVKKTTTKKSTTTKKPVKKPVKKTTTKKSTTTKKPVKKPIKKTTTKKSTTTKKPVKKPVKKTTTKKSTTKK